MTQRIDKKQESSIDDISLAADIGQKNGQNGHCAGRGYDSEKKAEQEGAGRSATADPEVFRRPEINLEKTEEMKAHDQTNGRDKIFPESSHIAEHPAHQCRNEPQNGERYRQSNDEK